MNRSRGAGDSPPSLAVALALVVAAGVASCGRSDQAGAARTAIGRPVNAPSAAEPAMDLPLAFGPWTRSSPPRRIQPSGIFDYMDGGGELYLAYGLRYLDLYEYSAPSQGTIQAELYTLGTSDDAFGLLSGDWGGEPVSLTQPTVSAPPEPLHRALYGAGLCRLWAARIYARVMASNETPASREQVLRIGRAIAAGQPTLAPPAMVAALPPTAPGGFSLCRDCVVFLRSHLVLNAAYYLAPRDLLGLGPETEAVHAVFERSRPGGAPARVHLVAVRYGDATAASRGWEGFRAAYLPEHGKRDIRVGSAGALAIEDGWLGFHLQERTLALVFEAPDRDLARALAEDAARRLSR